MPIYSGTFATIGLAELLRLLVQAKRTGHLNMHDAEHGGMVAFENGLIVNAKTNSMNGMPALFQFVSWRDADFEFREQPLAPDLPRDLSVYDPEVLISGVASKVKEWAVLQRAIPSVIAPISATG